MSDTMRQTARGEVLAALNDLVDRLEQAGEAVAAGEHDSAHRMRTAVRRVRAVLVAARRIAPREPIDALRHELRQLGRDLEPARQAELEFDLGEWAAAEADARVDDPLRVRLPRRAAATAAVERAAIARRLAEPEHRALLERLRAVGDLPEVPVDASPTKFARRALRRDARRTHRAVAAAGNSVAAAHELRKAAKRTRYLAEELGVRTAAQGAESLAEAASVLQDAIGDERDARAAESLLLDVAGAAAAAGEDTAAYHRLADLQRRSAEEAAGRLPDAIAEFERARRRL